MEQLQVLKEKSVNLNYLYKSLCMYNLTKASDKLMSLTLNKSKQDEFNEAKENIQNVVKYCIQTKKLDIEDNQTDLYMLVYFVKKYTKLSNIELANSLTLNRMKIQRVVNELVQNNFLVKNDLRYTWGKK